MSDLHAQTVPYVRDTMLPPAAPPASEVGAIRWLRENLLSGPMNIALTVVGLAFVYWFLSGVLPWLMHSVWNANSLAECRDIVAKTWGPDAIGACWAMIRERWHQYMFGFYPQDLYWRPVMAFFLLFPALAPVLYSGDRRSGVALVAVTTLVMLVILYQLDATSIALLAAFLLSAALVAVAYVDPRRLLWFTLLYPPLAFWLVWGGSAWWWVMAIFGIGVGYAVFRASVSRIGAATAAGVGLVVAAIWWIYAVAPLSAQMQAALPASIAAVASDRFGGFLLSITIGVTAISGSLPLGIILALGRRSDMPLVKGLSVGFIEFVRGVPLITVLFTASLLLQYFLPPQTQFDIILRVIIMATLFAAAYIAEVIRGGLAALPRGQYEAADALGLDYWKAQRLIIMPQALKISIPGIVSSFIGLFKDTTLVAFVGLLDPLKGITQIVRADINWKGIYWEPYIFAGAIFFIICFGMSRYSMYLERKLKRDHR
jgi:general L-amino acid transport system permease protein